VRPTSRESIYKGPIYKGPTLRRPTSRGSTYRGQTSKGQTFGGQTFGGQTFGGLISKELISVGLTLQGQTYGMQIFRELISRGLVYGMQTSSVPPSQTNLTVHVYGWLTFEALVSRRPTYKGSILRAPTFKRLVYEGLIFKELTSYMLTFRGLIYEEPTFKRSVYEESCSKGLISRGPFSRPNPTRPEVAPNPIHRIRRRRDARASTRAPLPVSPHTPVSAQAGLRAGGWVTRQRASSSRAWGGYSPVKL
jgi:hypothetical protein